LSTGIGAIVVQLGLATMPFGIWASACALTSVTTSGTSESIRHADELSITIAPAARDGRREGQRCRLARAEERDVEAGEVGRGSVFHHNLTTLPVEGRAGRPARGEITHLVDGKGPIDEQATHDSADLAGGSEHSDSHGLQGYRPSPSARTEYLRVAQPFCSSNAS
jgi:hypothetical protein